MKITHNFRFPHAETEEPPRFEGELRPDEPLWENEDGETSPSDAPKMLSIPRKRPYSQVDDTTAEPRRSTRPKVVHDYQQLNDPSYEETNDVADVLAEMVYLTFGGDNSASEDPKDLKEARESPEWPEWEKAIQAELDQLKRMGTWELTDLPEGRKPVTNKWVFVRKYTKEGLLAKYKARLVA